LALFFDANWFHKRLAALNLRQEDVARAVGWSRDELALVLKDQMEVRARDVTILAALLDVSAEEIANRCGVSTPVGVKPIGTETQFALLLTRLAHLEARVAALEAAQKEGYTTN